MTLSALRLRARHSAWRVKRAWRDAVILGGTDRKTVREDIALRFLSCEGIEIGALDFPLRMPRSARVQYVDYLEPRALERAHSQTLAQGRPLVKPDVVDDGTRLGSFADSSLDFVVANHMLEHAEDPIGALKHQLRVLRPRGVLLLSLPDARHSFDAARPLTSVEHLLRDHELGPEQSRREHFEECAHIIESRQGGEIGARADEMEAEGMRPHFHVWVPLTFAAFLAATELPCSLALLQESVGEFVVVLRKLGGDAARASLYAGCRAAAGLTPPFGSVGQGHTAKHLQGAEWCQEARKVGRKYRAV